MSLSQLRNIGPASERMLASIGVTTVDQLRELGPVAAYRLLRAQRDDVSLNMLYALEGALTDQRWDRLPAARRAALRAEAEALRFTS